MKHPTIAQGQFTNFLFARFPAPLRQPSFRLLWAGMGLSYAGDRLQELAQGWLVALLSGSALAVGAISILASIPMLLMPLGGVVADQVDRRRLMIAGQFVGALTSTIVGLLVWSKIVATWHIYAWALISGLVWVLMRPAYKVALTAMVPMDQVRQAVGINSITETIAIVLMNGLGGILVAKLGLVAAFAFNAFTYLFAIACLTRLRSSEPGLVKGLSPRQVFKDLKDGLSCLKDTRGLLFPLLQTFLFIACMYPLVSLLPAIVRSQSGTVVTLGFLGAAMSLGSLLGAAYAGARGEGQPVRTYAIFGLLAGGALLIFTFNPLGPTGMFSLAVIGFLAFSQAVWNTSRVPRLAEPVYQARLQSLTSMGFTLGGALGALWGGVLVDRYGLSSLLIGGALLALISLVILVRSVLLRRTDASSLPDEQRKGLSQK